MTSLTPREGQVMAYIAQGLSNKLIANELGISENTVKVFVGKILNKVGATNRTEALVKFQRSQHGQS